MEDEFSDVQEMQSFGNLGIALTETLPWHKIIENGGYIVSTLGLKRVMNRWHHKLPAGIM